MAQPENFAGRYNSNDTIKMPFYDRQVDKRLIKIECELYFHLKMGNFHEKFIGFGVSVTNRVNNLECVQLVLSVES